MPLTIGQHLKKAREQRYITLEKASEETRIRMVLIKALEADDYSMMPSAAQGRGFLRNYAEYLDINIDEVIAELQRNAPPSEELSGPLPQVKPTETEVPPLTDSTAEEKPPRFWMLRSFDTTSIRLRQSTWLLRTTLRSAQAWFARRQKTESFLTVDSTESASRALEAERAEERVEAENLPIELEQAEVREEAKPNLLARLASLFRIQFAKSKSETSASIEAEEPNKSVFEAGPKPIAPAESAQVIFAEIGKKLHERREMLSLTIDEVERHTRMRAAYVRALEEGMVDKLPSPVQTRGMLANYAAFLDLDADVILLRFADALQARRREKYSETPREQIQTQVKTSMPILRSFIAGDLIFGMVMIALILALAVWGIGSVLSSRDRETVQATAPSIVEVLAGTPLPPPSADETFVPVGDAPIGTSAFGLTTVEAPTLGANINVVVGIFAVERTYLRVRVDGEAAFEGRIAPRETQQFEAENQIEVLTGNGAALRISFNGRDFGLMGNVGEVVNRVYTIAGVVTPTATIPPTPTETPFVTSTPTPTTTRTATAESTATP